MYVQTWRKTSFSTGTVKLWQEEQNSLNVISSKFQVLCHSDLIPIFLLSFRPPVSFTILFRSTFENLKKFRNNKMSSKEVLKYRKSFYTKKTTYLYFSFFFNGTFYEETVLRFSYGLHNFAVHSVAAGPEKPEKWQRIYFLPSNFTSFWKRNLFIYLKYHKLYITWYNKTLNKFYFNFF